MYHMRSGCLPHDTESVRLSALGWALRTEFTVLLLRARSCIRLSADPDVTMDLVDSNDNDPLMDRRFLRTHSGMPDRQSHQASTYEMATETYLDTVPCFLKSLAIDMSTPEELPFSAECKSPDLRYGDVHPDGRETCSDLSMRDVA